MVVELGHFALCLALVTAALQAVVPLYLLRRDPGLAAAFADRAAQAQILAMAASFAALTYAFVVSDFSVRLVAANSHSIKPLIYKISGVWANHEGSMMLWVLILSLFGGLIASYGREIPSAMRAATLSAQAMIGVGFLAFVLLTSNPFARLAAAPADGAGMNPLLQDPGVALHPPMLYIGYVGFSTAFSFAVAALLLGRVDASWARWMRPWALLAWSTLTLGIGLGSWWAYYELGWGGFWFWDPVENASFMPWLLGTALLHSALVVERREGLLRWTVLLAILTFALSLIGTFLVRSGVLSSVHAFATDPERGVFILALLAVAIGGSLALYAFRASSLNEGGLYKPVSREGALLLNNAILAVCCGIVFVGTLYPLVLEATTGAKITVGPPYFNSTFVPIFCFGAALAAFGPALGWKSADPGKAFARLRGAAIFAVLAAAALALFAGYRDPLGLLGFLLALWLLAASVQIVIERAGLKRSGFSGALGRLAGLRASVWGLALAHAGLAVTIAGVTAISVWKVEAIQIQNPGDGVAVGPYQFTLEGVGMGQGPNYQTSAARVIVTRDGAPVTTLRPERRWYPVERQSTVEAGIVTLWHGDLYAVLGDPGPSGGFVTRFYYNPGAAWMWAGVILMTLGGLASFVDRRLQVGAPSRRAALAAATALAAAILFAPAPAGAIDADEILDDPALESRAIEISKELRCVVCQNQSIFDSDAAIAKDLRVLVRQRLKEGDSNEEAKAKIVEYYGDFVLMRPPVNSSTFILWAAPLALTALAGLAAFSHFRSRSKTRSAALSDEESAEARRLLDGGIE